MPGANPEHLPSMHDRGSLSQEAETRSVGDVPKVASEWVGSLIRSMKRMNRGTNAGKVKIHRIVKPN